MNTLEELGRSKIKELLSQCTEAQIHLFNRMYVSTDKIPLEDMSRALQQIERTLEKKQSTDTPPEDLDKVIEEMERTLAKQKPVGRRCCWCNKAINISPEEGGCYC